MNDEEDETKPNVLTDDEDSNAESFYQNDYPSDEDAGAFSEQDSLEEEMKVMFLMMGLDSKVMMNILIMKNWKILMLKTTIMKKKKKQIMKMNLVGLNAISFSSLILMIPSRYIEIKYLVN